MRLKLNVDLEKEDGSDETLLVLADGRDIRKYEAEFERSWVTSELSATQMAQVAWLAARRNGQFKGSWDVFDAACTAVRSATNDDLEDGEVETANPTQLAVEAKP